MYPFHTYYFSPEERARRRASLSREQLLIERCELYVCQGRLRFGGPGEIHLVGRRRFLKGRFGSRFFRCAVEALTRQFHGIVSCRVARSGKPVDVTLACPNCRKKSRRWSWHHEEKFPSFYLDEWPVGGDRTKAYGHCSGCYASVVMRRESDGTWSAQIQRSAEEE